MRLTDHFTVDELIRGAGTTHVPDSVLINAQHTAEVLEAIRAKLGDRPLVVSSWYRPPAKNAAVGGTPNSAHLSGYGVDFNVPGMAPRDVIAALRPHVHALTFDQVIDERDHVHLSADPRGRRQILVEPAEGKYQALPPVVVREPAPGTDRSTAKIVAILTAAGTIITAIVKLLSEK